MRGNGGGFVDQTTWLATHLLPNKTATQFRLTGRFLASNERRNELTEQVLVLDSFSLASLVNFQLSSLWEAILKNLLL
jgi:C-terminal processing protease CtpA/Prc